MEEDKTTKNWIKEMIQRESTPKPLREGTVEEFCQKYEISEATYYYQRSKKDNKREIVKIWLNEAMDGGNEVLEKLKEKAKAGDNKSIELYLKFVLELAENLDIEANGKFVLEIAKQVADKNE